MTTWTTQSILADADEKGIEFVYLDFTDMNGLLKQLEIPVKQLKAAFDGKFIIDGSSIAGFSSIESSDMFLVPDPTTWMIVPEEDGRKLARLICDINNTDGSPFTGSPRYILERMIDQMHEKGYEQLNIGLEAEFFLFERDENNQPIIEITDRGGYLDHSPNSRFQRCRREIAATLASIGFDIETVHHEAAPGQQEISWQFSDALSACDRFQTLKLVVKTVAEKFGLFATFLPKPIAGIAGSGMHCNISLQKDGMNLFYDEQTDDHLSLTAKQFIGGLVMHAKSFTAITNPTINSYKRLIPGFEAPIYIAWSAKNRSTLLRIPSTSGQSTRLELRCADAASNPYLVVACILAAGLAGIKKNIAAPNPVDLNIYHMSEDQRVAEGIHQLPQSLDQALESLTESSLIVDTLGAHLTEQFIKRKQEEIALYKQQISQWEIDYYIKSNRI